ncbi:MAG: hypothetical protein JNK75_01200 [Betaproteobacteria bacterium]|nr:hypothetical protein [Betaproteobacteria bacterium]
MSTHPAIQGIEFDWFASDRSGNIALFSTAGAGFVPEGVISSREEHQSISDSFETPHWGSENIWDDYAQLGIFVFDWALNGGPYMLARAPTKTISEQLSAKLRSISFLPKLKVDFQSCTSISKVELANDT